MLLAGKTGTAFRAGYRAVTMSCVATGLLLASSLSAIAAGGSYEPGKEIAGGTDVGYTWSTYAVTSDDYVYQYATDTAGTAWYNSYDGTEWAGWASYEDQPAVVTYDPAPVYHNDSAYVFYTGDAGELYYVTGTDAGTPEWTDIAGDYAFDSAPAATDYDGQVDLYATADDGYVYGTYSSGDGWADWTPVNDEATKGKAGTEPYAVAWGGYDNVFWTGDDGTVYWNRYDGETWTGARPLAGDYTFDYAAYAVGYEPEESLYAYAATSDGAPAYNVFDGEAWAGWQTYDVEWKATGQPNAYVYDDTQHIVYGSGVKKAWYNSYTVADGYGAEFQDLGENYGYGAQQYSYADGLYLTYTGEDGSVYYRTFADGPANEPSDDSAYPEPSPSDDY